MQDKVKCSICIYGEPVNVTGKCFDGETIRCYICLRTRQLNARDHPCSVPDDELPPPRPRKPVRCKNCEHIEIKDYVCAICSLTGRPVAPDDTCGYKG